MEKVSKKEAEYRLGLIEKSLKAKAEKYTGENIIVLAPSDDIGGLVSVCNVTFSCNEEEILDYLGAIIDIENQIKDLPSGEKGMFPPRKFAARSWTIVKIQESDAYSVRLRGIHWIVQSSEAAALYFALKEYIYAAKSNGLLLNFV